MDSPTTTPAFFLLTFRCPKCISLFYGLGRTQENLLPKVTRAYVARSVGRERNESQIREHCSLLVVTGENVGIKSTAGPGLTCERRQSLTCYQNYGGFAWTDNTSDGMRSERRADMWGGKSNVCFAPGFNCKSPSENQKSNSRKLSLSMLVLGALRSH